MKRNRVPHPGSLILILAITSQLLTTASIELLAQNEGSKALVAEKPNSKQIVTFNVGQTASYKTVQSKVFQKGVISEITDSTISFTNKKFGTIIVTFRDLKELKALRPGRSGGGIALVATGIAGVVFGAIVVGIDVDNSGSGKAWPAVLIPVGGALLVAGGIALLQPDVANTSTLNTKSNQELDDAAKQSALADTVQFYKKLKVGAFVGYAASSGSTGVLVSLEPAVRLNDDVAIGLRIENDALRIPEWYLAGNPGATVPGSSGTTSVTANGQVYLSDGDFRPFLGFGMGPFFFSNPTIMKIGFYPRLGFDASHFTLTADYNFISKVSGYADPNPCSDPANIGNCGGVYHYEQNFSYLAFRLGYVFGGGKK